MSERNTKTVVLISALLIALGSLASGCGGGGGGGGAALPPLSLLSGAYAWQRVEYLAASTPEALAQWGTLVLDGAGSSTGGSFTANASGTVAGPVAPPTFTYAIAAGHRVTFSSTSTSALRGGCSPTGDLVSLCQTTSSWNPSVAILGHRHAASTPASLAGAWHACAFMSTATDDRTWWEGTLTLDAATMKVTTSVGINANGSITAPAAPVVNGTWSTGVGLFTWTALGATLTGSVMLDGDLIVLSGSAAPGQPLALVVLIRKGVAVPLSAFSGAYHLLGLQATQLAHNGYAALTGTASADGLGHWTLLTGTFNQDGTVNVAASASPLLTYTVAPDGAFGSGDFNAGGGISANGKVAMYAGSRDASSSPILYFLHR